jgi:hypothetical protein
MPSFFERIFAPLHRGEKSAPRSAFLSAARRRTSFVLTLIVGSALLPGLHAQSGM